MDFSHISKDEYFNESELGIHRTNNDKNLHKH